MPADKPSRTDAASTTRKPSEAEIREIAGLMKSTTSADRQSALQKTVTAFGISLPSTTKLEYVDPAAAETDPRLAWKSDVPRFDAGNDVITVPDSTFACAASIHSEYPVRYLASKLIHEGTHAHQFAKRGIQKTNQDRIAREVAANDAVLVSLDELADGLAPGDAKAFRRRMPSLVSYQRGTDFSQLTPDNQKIFTHDGRYWSLLDPKR